jgi:hypothetical protein
MAFIKTPTGYRADDAQIEFWETRDACPACWTPVSPHETVNGIHRYRCGCEAPVIEWTRAV